MFSERKRKGTSLYDVVTYTLPKLHTGKNWYVDFKCYDPLEGSMKRKKFMLDSITKISERKKRATEIITVTTQRLRNGWNPWAEATTDRQCANFVYVTEIYNKYLEKLTSAKTLKQKTLYDYQSRLNMLLEYNNSRHLPIMYMYQFDQAYISDFLDYILLDRDASARTRNNYRTWLSTFCTWLKEKKYIEDNPTDKIRSLAEETKFRSALTKEDLAQLHEYLKETNKHFLLACQMEYYTFIRPDELTGIKIQDIYLQEQKIFVSSQISKNRRDGMVGLNKGLILKMVELGVFKSPGNYYLFGRDFRPSQKKADSRIFREEFLKVRKALKWPDSYQFYSLKDSGIRDLANAEGIVVARDQARHTDISTTNKYLKADLLSVPEETKKFEGNL